MTSVSSSIVRSMPGFGLPPETAGELNGVPNIVSVSPQSYETGLEQIGGRENGRFSSLQVFNERQHLVPALRGA